MSEIKQNLKSSFEKLINFYVRWILLFFFLLYAFTGIYNVEQNEIGIVKRFGKIIDDNIQPGLHYALPYPFDEVVKISVKQMKTLTINDFSNDEWPEGSKVASYVEKTKLRPYVISADNNIVNITLNVKYTISKPADYLYKVAEIENILSNICASTVVHTIAEIPVDEILTFGKKRIENTVKIEFQKRLNEIESGISISFVEIKDIMPPFEIQKNFNRVINAEVEKKKDRNNAESFRNTSVAEARSEANKILSEAQSYKKEKILIAEGAAERFKLQLDEYKKSQNINRKKIYLDFLQTIYPKLREIRYIDSKTGKEKLLTL